MDDWLKLISRVPPTALTLVVLYFVVPCPDDLHHLIIFRRYCSEIYLFERWDEIDGNEVGLMQVITVHSEIFGVPDVTALSSASSGHIIVFEENAAYFRHIPSRFALNADEFRSLCKE